MEDERALEQLLDEARAEAAAGERARQRWLRQQAAEDATLTGVLRSLIEAGAAVTLVTTAGQRHQGILAGAGNDFCCLQALAGRVYVALAGVAAVELAPGIAPADALDDREAAQDLCLRDLLARLSPDRPEVLVYLSGGAGSARGTLVEVGRDLLTLVPARQRSRVYVPVAAVSEVVLLARQLTPRWWASTDD